MAVCILLVYKLSVLTTLIFSIYVNTHASVCVAGLDGFHLEGFFSAKNPTDKHTSQTATTFLHEF